MWGQLTEEGFLNCLALTEVGSWTSYSSAVPACIDGMGAQPGFDLLIPIIQ